MTDSFRAQGGFAQSVPQNGYAWWYLDALSDDGQHGITIIAFIGSVFSPYYALARRFGPADPLHFCALNIAVYGRPARWAMTERGRGDITLTRDRFRIGPSEMMWEDGALKVRINERTMPDQRRLVGDLVLRPVVMVDHQEILDAHARHRWRPFAPLSRVELNLRRPDLRWSGTGYFDSNAGSEPLEAGFSDWSWSRGTDGESTIVLYDATCRDGSRFERALRFDAAGQAHIAAQPAIARLPRGLWGVARPTRADAGTTPRLIRRLEDAPFYTRSEIRSQINGQALHGVHESLDLNRFRHPIVQMMLPFRMPRIARR